MVTLTSRSWGHFDLEPTYHVNMVMIGGHQGRQMSILRVDLERSISDLEGKNSKFRLLESLRTSMTLKNIPMHF